MYEDKNVLALVKARLNRLQSDKTLDDYLLARIEAAHAELEQKGLIMSDTVDDHVLLTDYAVYQYQARDMSGGMPD